MQDAQYRDEQIAAYGSTAQPAIAARMAPHLRLTQVGVVCAVVGVGLAAAALATFPPPSFTDGTAGRGWAVTALVAAVLMLGLAVTQLVVWRTAMASWRGVRPEDLRTEALVSWVAHLVSYAVAVLALVACMEASAAAGWTATAAALLAFTLLLVLAAQSLAGVQFLRASGPPGTLPAHMRRLIARAQPRRTTAEDRRLGR